MSTTALAILTTAFEVLEVFMPGDSIPAADGATGLRFLNNLVGQWARQMQTIPAVVRSEFPLVAGKGGPSAPYTIGPGGDFNLARPTTAAQLTGAGLLLGGTLPADELRRAVYTDAMYAAVSIKEMQNPLFTGVYLNLTDVGGLATVQLWPVPNTSLHRLVLYLKTALTAFAALATPYDLPTGYDEALAYNLARRLAKPYGKTVDDDLLDLARSSLAVVKRSNTPMSDLALDPMFTQGSPAQGYNIDTGS